MIALSEIETFRAQLLAERKPVDVPEWGLTGDRALRVTRLRADAWLRLKAMARGGVPADDESAESLEFFVETIAGSVVDPSGAYLFASDEGRALLRTSDIASVLLLANAAIAFNRGEQGA